MSRRWRRLAKPLRGGAGAAILGLLCVGFLRAGDEGALSGNDPDAALQAAHKWKAQNQRALDGLLAATTSQKRAEAVRDFLARSEKDAVSAPAILDLDATICSPSERLMLLDRIGNIPSPLEEGDVIAISRAVLDSKSPEERVVALRNLARFSSGDRSMVSERLQGILRDAGGEKDEAFAFGQAFDGVVFLRDEDAVPLLVELLKDKKNGPLAGATLDRLAEADPPRMAAYLGDHPDVLRDFPLLRADYYAKGSLSSDDYRKLVEKYLQRPDVDDKEAEKFFFSYLQGGTFLVNGIFTGEAAAPPDGPDRMEEMQAAARRWEKVPAMGKAVKAEKSVRAQIGADPPDAEPK